MPRVSVLRRTLLSLPALGLALSLTSCGEKNDGVADEESARLAYLGLDAAVGRAIQLGFDGFNAASNANIPEQMQAGELGGVMIVGGQVDAGSSDNKGMRLKVTLQDDYADVVLEGERAVVYNGGPALLNMNFKGLPTAELTGTLKGNFVMEGDLLGGVTLDVTFTGVTEAGPGDTIVRTPGSVRVTGTATSDYGVFAIEVDV